MLLQVSSKYILSGFNLYRVFRQLFSYLFIEYDIGVLFYYEPLFPLCEDYECCVYSECYLLSSSVFYYTENNKVNILPVLVYRPHQWRSTSPSLTDLSRTP